VTRASLAFSSLLWRYGGMKRAVQVTPAAAKPRKSKGKETSGGNYQKKLAVACEAFCNGASVDEIVTRMTIMFPNDVITREYPYRLLREGAKRGWLRFSPQEEENLAKLLISSFPFLSSSASTLPKAVNVVQSPLTESVAERAAAVILELIQARVRDGQTELHIGWAGGKTPAITARKLRELFEQRPDGLPKKIVWHALTASLDAGWPGLSPAGFLPYLADYPVRKPSEGLHENEFVVFGAPPVATFPLYEKLKKMPTIADAFRQKKKLDIVITSAGSFNDPDSMLRASYKKFFLGPENRRAKTFTDQLKDRGCVGDMLWQPLCVKNPLNYGELKGKDRTDIFYRPFALLELHELPDFIAKGTSVVLALGHCQLCLRDKSDILREILRFSADSVHNQLVTHIVADSMSVSRALLEK
jgi:hypothetical protein